MAQLRAARVRQRLGREVDEWQLLVRKYYSAVEAERAERALVAAESARQAGDEAREARQREARYERR